ncbi:MCE family protein [Polynucleobacter sp. MWH-P3-07-1]|uniref:MlaD family protein n=1 Tax=Polynucleobacter sp. MWH-P3-07-1 TaxID=1743173 RepID=UPI001BFEC27C|nr:MlaD family protein [Polynucleobacter sp. MWH-P3-07-1]QWD82919.1 MCE family protein [Polynucleobacter sp. MWH-P3-07-1]
MTNNANPNYFRLGAFVLSAIAVLIAIILIFGGGRLFKPSFMVETYVKQSVTGLDVGAPVRFRGVKIGQVTLVGLSGDMYEKETPITERKEYVVIRMQIFGDKIDQESLNTFVQDRLRTRVKSMGITGVNYVEFDFASHSSAEMYPPLKFPWKPEYFEIPSLPSQADEILSGLQKIVDSLSKADIQETQQKFNALLTNLNVLMAGDGKGNQGVVKSVQELNVVLERIAKVTDKGELEVLTRELIGSMVSLRQTLTSVQGNTEISMENIRQTTEQLNELSRIASRSPATLIWGEPPPKIILPMNGTQSGSAAGGQK